MRIDTRWTIVLSAAALACFVAVKKKERRRAAEEDRNAELISLYRPAIDRALSSAQ